MILKESSKFIIFECYMCFTTLQKVNWNPRKLRRTFLSKNWSFKSYLISKKIHSSFHKVSSTNAQGMYWAITKTYHILRTSRLICNILLPSQLNWIKPPRNTTNLIVLALNCNMHWRKNATKCYKLVLRLRILIPTFSWCWWRKHYHIIW